MQAYSKQNKHYKYLLMVIDVFSKYGWIVPIKNKKGETVAEAFKKILKEGRTPNKLWVDAGKEFYNQHVKSLFPDMYSTQNEEKSSVVERWNRTMKEKMYKYFTANDTTKYYDVLDKLVDEYNNTVHSSIKMTPVEASEKKNETTVYKTLYPHEEPPKKPKFELGNRVRITKKKKFFEKGYTPNYTREIFVISEVQYTNPITYRIKDLNGEEIMGSFYEKELLKTKF